MKTSLFLLFSRAMIAAIVAVTFLQAVNAGGHRAADRGIATILRRHLPGGLPPGGGAFAECPRF